MVLMSKWPTIKVGENVERRTERVAIEPGRQYDTMGMRWYGKGAYLRPPCRPKTKTLGVARTGDFVFCRIDAQNGPFGIVPQELDGALVTNEFPLYTVDESALDPRFLALCFARQSTLELIGKRREGRDGRARWKEPDFEDWSIPFPPLAMQSRIVEVVAAVDSTLKALEDEIIAAKTARVALLDHLIRDLDGDVTEYTLGDVAAWSAGKTPKADNPAFYSGTIPWAVIGDVQGRIINDTARRITQAGLDEIGGLKKLAPSGSVLITMYGTIGNTAITGVPMATNQAICRGIPNNLVSADYLRLWVSARKADLISLGEGKTQQNISKEKIERFPIMVPSSLDQDRVVRIFTSVDNQIEALEHEHEHAAIMRSALLESLLSRDIEIMSIGNDEDTIDGL